MFGGVIGLKSLGVRFCGTKSERDRETEVFGKICASARILGKFALSVGDKRTRQAFAKVVWDTPSDTFKLRTDIYDGSHCRVSGYELDVPHGIALSDDFVAGAIVDQVSKKIMLPDGRSIDGPTGDVYNVHGTVVLYKDRVRAKAEKEKLLEKEC
jgi:hypothetical protein